LKEGITHINMVPSKKGKFWTLSQLFLVLIIFVKPKGAKEILNREEKVGLLCVAQDGLVLPIGQFGVHRTVRCTVRPSGCSREKLASVGYKSPESPCRTRGQSSVPASQRLVVTSARTIGHMEHRTVRCPQNRKPTNLMTCSHYTVQCLVCTHGQKATRAFQMELQRLLGPLRL
jgi:hypothetical protein